MENERRFRGTVYDGVVRHARPLLRTALAILLLATGTPTAPAQTSPPPGPGAQKTAAGALGASIEIREEFLGKSGDKTVVKFTLVASKGELAKVVNAAPRVYSFFLNADVKTQDGGTVETFRVPVDVDLSNLDVAKPLQASFLHSLPPGSFTIQFGLEGVAGKLIGTRNVSLNVPAMTTEFHAEDAGLSPGGLPSAAAVILESENRAAPPKGAEGLVKILAPKRKSRSASFASSAR